MLQGETFLTCFTDGMKSWYQRVFVLAVLLAMALWVNDVMQFTHYYRLKHKVDIFDNLARIIGDSTLDSLSKKQAAAFRKELLDEEPLFAYYHGSFFLKLNGGFEKSTQKKKPNPRKLPAIMNNHSKMFIMLEYLKLLIYIRNFFLNRYDGNSHCGNEV